MREAVAQRVRAAHRQSGHRARARAALRAPVRLDVRDDVLQQVVAEIVVGEEIGAGPVRRVAERHHDDHRLRLPGGDEIVEDVVRVADGGPAVVAVAGAVHEIEHGVARRALHVARRRVHVRAPLGAERRRPVLDRGHHAVRDLRIVRLERAVRARPPRARCSCRHARARIASPADRARARRRRGSCSGTCPARTAPTSSRSTARSCPSPSPARAARRSRAGWRAGSPSSSPSPRSPRARTGETSRAGR